ncbi:hypothetical protein DH86_00001167, partial [Scytalidium sp. 3C]
MDCASAATGTELLVGCGTEYLFQGSLYTTQYTWRLLLATLPSPSDPVFCVIRAGRIADAQLDSMSIRQHQVHAASSVHDGSAWGVAAPHAIWP